MRLVFAGTPEVAVISLRALVAAGADVVGVLTREDAPLGRRRTLTPSPVAAAATDLGLTVIKANRIDDVVTAQIDALEPDLGVIVAYGAILREPLLSTPRLGWINLHFSLLPRWRGAAPVQHAIIAGDTVTGVSVFQLVAALDAGDVFAQREHTIEWDATAATVLDDLARIGADTLIDVVDDLAAGRARASAQVGPVTLAPKLTLDDGRVRWNAPSRAVLDRIRGTTPEPGAHTSIGGLRVKILAAAPIDNAEALSPGCMKMAGKDLIVGTLDGAIQVRRVQPAGKPAMDATDWWRGLRVSELCADEDATSVSSGGGGAAG